MVPNEESSPASRSRARVATLALVLGVLALRLLALAAAPAELLGDEAHYWEWSRHPSLSYYTKGPGVAWVIAAGTAAFGDSEFGVRWLSAVLGAATALCCARLAEICAPGRAGRRAGFLAALLVTCHPLGAVLFSVMTIDAPLMASVAVSVLLARRLLGPVAPPRAPWIWAGLGLVLAFGFLAKYVAALLAPGLLWHGLRLRREGRRFGVGPGIACATFLLGASPILFWNWAHDWPTVTHLLGHLHVEGGDRPSAPAEPWRTVPVFLLEQIATLGPAALLVLGALLGRARSESERFLRACALPFLVFHLAVAFQARVQPNWLVAGYLPLFALAACRAARAIEEGRFGRGARTLWGATALAGVLTILLLAAAGWMSRQPSFQDLGPLKRVSGQRDRAATVVRAVDELRRRTGREPLVIAGRYDVASLLAFYLPGRPRVHCAASRLGDRKNAYDFFEDTDLGDASLRGRPAVLVRVRGSRWKEAFDADEPRSVAGDLLVIEDYRGPRESLEERR